MAKSIELPSLFHILYYRFQRLHTLMKDPSLSIAELQKIFGIGKSSLYRYRD